MTDMLEKIEYGDFQTPSELADEVCGFLAGCGVNPDAIIEPTCGDGSFIVSAYRHFTNLKNVIGYDVSHRHLANARQTLWRHGLNAVLEQQDFFDANWSSILSSAGAHPLVLGNLPWVTSARLGSMNSGNLPEKSNFQKHEGFAAKTGKANFDISEWMLIKLLEASHSKTVDLAILCKLSTARKVLKFAWTNGHSVSAASLHVINAATYFGASVAACLLFMRLGNVPQSCSIADQYDGLSYQLKTGQVGIAKGELVSDAKAYQTYSELDGQEHHKWRSGIKHDASTVMELDIRGGSYYNKLNEKCEIESDYVYPFLKSSDLANNRIIPNRFVVVPQFHINDDTSILQAAAPNLWRYLEMHQTYLDSRKSSIYRNRPRFSIFGIGDYSFAHWKIAIAGMYKSFGFVKIGTYLNKPILLDDTCYFLSCQSETEADILLELLKSRPAQVFLRSLTFFDAKRPVTVDILKRLDLIKLSEFLGRNDFTKAMKNLKPTKSPTDQGVFSF